MVKTFSRDSFLLRYDTASMGRLVPTLQNMRALCYEHRDPVAHWSCVISQEGSCATPLRKSQNWGNVFISQATVTCKRYWVYCRLYRVIRNDYRDSNNCHLVLQMQPHMISSYGVTSRIRYLFLLFPQVSRNWRYESEPPLKPPPLTRYKQFGTNSIIVLMFVESQRVHI